MVQLVGAVKTFPCSSRLACRARPTDQVMEELNLNKYIFIYKTRGIQTQTFLYYVDHFNEDM